MKIETYDKQDRFAPIEVRFTIETAGELACLLAELNQSPVDLKEQWEELRANFPALPREWEHEDCEAVSELWAELRATAINRKYDE